MLSFTLKMMTDYLEFAINLKHLGPNGSREKKIQNSFWKQGGIEVSLNISDLL